LRKAKDFITTELQAMTDYLLAVSTQKSELRSRFPPDLDAAQTDRLHIMQSMNRQLSVLHQLHRESIPQWPYMIDVPQQLALITSLIVRNCKNIDGNVISNISGPASSNTLAGIGEFVCQCLDIETLALQQVNNVARLGLDSKEALAYHHHSTSGTTIGHELVPLKSMTDNVRSSSSANQVTIAQRSAEQAPNEATGKLVRRKPAPKFPDTNAVDNDVHLTRSSSSSLIPLNSPQRHEESGRSSPNGSDSEQADKKRKAPWNIFRK